jgi:hypothetical protein
MTDKNTRIVLCPHCDREHRIGHGAMQIKCGSCLRGFSAGREKAGHDERFWHNPDTSVYF